jgi:hypothetical protein
VDGGLLSGGRNELPLHYKMASLLHVISSRRTTSSSTFTRLLREPRKPSRSAACIFPPFRRRRPSRPRKLQETAARIPGRSSDPDHRTTPTAFLFSCPALFSLLEIKGKNPLDPRFDQRTFPFGFTLLSFPLLCFASRKVKNPIQTAFAQIQGRGVRGFELELRLRVLDLLFLHICLVRLFACREPRLEHEIFEGLFGDGEPELHTVQP